MTRAFTLGFFAGLGAALWRVKVPRRPRRRVPWYVTLWVEEQIALRRLMEEEERRIFEGIRTDLQAGFITRTEARRRAEAAGCL